MLKVQRFGWRPDLPDVRDKLLKAPHPDKVAALPDQVDLRSQFTPVYDQGQLGSCTANAIAGVLEFDQHKQGEARAFMPSRLFIYYNERVMEGTVNEDAGAEIRDGIKSVNQQGAPNEDNWPYVISQFAQKPPASAYKHAKTRKALLYQRLDNTRIDDLRACIAGGFPFVFGFTVYASFESRDMEKTGIVKMPVRGEQILGGHAVVACGYDHGRQLFWVRNSWGDSWGPFKGYFMIPYAYLTNTNLAADFWQISKVK